MRVSFSSNWLVVAIVMALLPLVLFGGKAIAQSGTQDDTTGTQSRPVIGTITNTASAQWNFEGRGVTAVSNEVSFDVTLPPPEILPYRPSAGGSTQLVFREPACSGSAGAGVQASTLSNNAQPRDVMVEPSNILRAGQNLMYTIQALAANTDPNAVDQLNVVITTSTGDRETQTIFETGVNTGMFVGQMATIRMPPPMQVDDCRLSVVDGSSITITADIDGPIPATVTTQVEVLVDPYGMVFDSETGEPINGARVTLID
ncbi:MAG: hypothetical protein AAFY07_12195, partial [Pseudomonadota bacterium]